MNNVIEGNAGACVKYGSECCCPYVNALDICTASINLIAVTPYLRASFCGTENHDNCPIFLSKVLRRR